MEEEALFGHGQRIVGLCAFIKAHHTFHEAIAIEPRAFELVADIPISTRQLCDRLPDAKPQVVWISDRSLKEGCIESKPQLETHGPLAQNQPLLDA